ncbi:hypothetical protein EF888_14635 [Silicimonas algicola]|uniref:DUF5681 domain-containing protein n=1 Tax=Silicimonas algicola TaxID=1826607 RepID=A0A316G104_9RHOB|nr:DUF5681 domain-containing protein [Silicimonas algicola]AZQ68263.1 hypothetical protein EF888_14635 [Silicimonas algicola]PWK54601.1 hypothetical protein C8D95_11135 [Silicimonas algicola]
MSQPDDFDVGYRKPPAATRFKKGQSGNPKGRPKGSRNISTLIEETLFRKVSIRDERGARKVPLAEALMQKLSVDALKGDPRALAKIIDLMKFYDARRDQVSEDRDGPDGGTPFRITDSDLEIMRYLAQEIEAAGEDVSGDVS